jgi:hypothetical protein
VISTKASTSSTADSANPSAVRVVRTLIISPRMSAIT